MKKGRRLEYEKYEPRRIRRVDSRFKFIANMKCLRRIDSCPLARPEENLRSGFLDPFFSANKDRVQAREYLESLERLNCAAKSKAQQKRKTLSVLFVPTVNVNQRSRQ